VRKASKHYDRGRGYRYMSEANGFEFCRCGVVDERVNVRVIVRNESSFSNWK
jgi:hypothetical protein